MFEPENNIPKPNSPSGGHEPSPDNTPQAETSGFAAPSASDNKPFCSNGLDFARRRSILSQNFFAHHVSLGDYLAATDQLRRDEKAVGYWVGTRTPPAPDPYATPDPEPEHSFVDGLSATFASYYDRWPAALRRRRRRFALLCAGGQAKLLQPLSERNQVAWTVVHPDARVTKRLKGALREDPVVQDLARQLIPRQGKTRDDVTFLAELAAAKTRVRTAPIEQTGLPGSSYDLVVIDHAHLCADLEPVYTEVRRLLRRGGMVIVTGHLPILPGGKLDSLVWEMIELLRPVFNRHERGLYRSFRTATFPFRPVKPRRVTDRHRSLAWTCAASWNLPTFTAQIQAWPAYQRLARSKDDRRLEIAHLLERVEVEWGRASSKREVCVPVIAHAGLKLD